MIVHGSLQLDDSVMRPYCFSRHIARNYYENECELFIVYGMPEGIGKSALVNHVMADLAGYRAAKGECLQWMWKRNVPVDVPKWPCDWEAIKPRIIYYPKDMVELCVTMLEKEQREMCVEWDDGGTWIGAMDFNDPFVKAFMEYASLARSNWGAIIITTPVEEWVLKKLHTAAGIQHVKVIKEKDNQTHPFRPRTARCYSVVRYPGRARRYVNRKFEDHFSAIMPDDFYAWYKPRRDQYALAAVHKMRTALTGRKKRGWDITVDEEAVESVAESIAEANDLAVELSEVVAQKIEA